MASTRRRSIPAFLVLLSTALTLALACERDAAERAQEVAVEVDAIAVDPVSGAPVVVLRESGGDRSLPIWIGFEEARSIAEEMSHQHPPRPNTHDLAKLLIDRLQGALQRVVVTDLRDGTYYAALFLISHGELLEVDARPSDAIALALRCGAPVFVRAPVFADAARAVAPPPNEHST